MKNIEPTNLDDALHHAWKPLGKIELIPRQFTDETISTWFEMILRPLNLPNDFTARLIEEAQRVTRRGLANPQSVSDPIHLTVLVPITKIPDSKTWGFFHTARNGADHKAAGSGSHLINYYLFTEWS